MSVTTGYPSSITALIASPKHYSFRKYMSHIELYKWKKRLKVFYGTYFLGHIDTKNGTKTFITSNDFILLMEGDASHWQLIEGLL